MGIVRLIGQKGRAIELDCNVDDFVTTNNQGWVCSQCGTWVPNGCVHACFNTSPYVPTVPPVPQFPATSNPVSTFGPCLGMTDHDFVIGRQCAICNRCEKVVAFDSWLKQFLTWCRSKVGLIND